ncbi:MAG: thrombospondin type 3 repeat-containing protein, partial [Saprospiraceae bacterium]
MKHFLPLFSLLFLLQITAVAQPKHMLSLRYNALNYITPQSADHRFEEAYTKTNGYGLEVEYGFRVAPKTYLTFPLKVGKGKVAENSHGDGTDRIIGNLDLLLHYNFLKYTYFLNPSLHFGVGTGWYPEIPDLDLNLPMGLGLDFRLSKRVHLTAQTQYRLAGGKRAGWQHAIGLTQYLGKDKTEDRDGDGVPDLTDACPDLPGVASLMGCPDRDQDGVTDAEDRCPDVAGTMALMGCPDRDNDGVSDLDDACPDVAGTMAMHGCPDTDNDGITDA